MISDILSREDIQYLNENHKEFKDNTDRRLTFLEQKKL
jgi:hypothetical protein